MGIRHVILPIERIASRYSLQWWRWLARSAYHLEAKVEFVGSYVSQKIKEGEFLDVYGTNLYKAHQLARLLRLLRSDHTSDFNILICDGWYPGLESLAYVRDAGRRRVRLTAILHAGTYDPWDFLTQRGLTSWAEHIERGWFHLLDRVFVATRFHQNLLISARQVDPAKISVVRFPVHYNPRHHGNPHREPIVVFPHRLAPEKDPEAFTRLHECYITRYGATPDGLHFVTTAAGGGCRNKSQYYALLSRCRVAVSTALQETFGIAMQEAVNAGCMPVAPNRLSYPETLRGHRLYESEDEAVDLIREGLLDYKCPRVLYPGDMDDILRRFLCQ